MPVEPSEMDASGARRFRFCPKCVARFDLQRIDDRERLVCTACDFIYYQNPIAGAAMLILDGDRVLLTQQKHGSGAGLWDVPGGYVEYDEDVREAGRHELLEETGIEVAVGEVYEALSNFHTPEVHTVELWFLGTVTGGRFFPLDALPELAFTTERQVLARLRDERGHPEHTSNG